MTSECSAWRVQAKLEASNGVLKLPLIKNKKTVNPRDSSSPPVFQLETAMGSAIECFDDAGAVVVPRERFAPVKTTNDLFGLRSDAYKVLRRLVMHAARQPYRSLYTSSGVILCSIVSCYWVIDKSAAASIIKGWGSAGNM